ncbi:MULTISPECIES: hypothetical protein [Cupriavidus]|uniref:hypothetical protein n=1 Tax=Cupriavidus sp. DF5525 TaxID=3160989 RepID=UPI0003B0352C|nr:hypothetical protein N234_37520 [Ralstonia pickettii DTP0602]
MSTITIDAMIAAGAPGLVEIGHHHEIYLSDPRKIAAEKLKTILRKPVRDEETPRELSDVYRMGRCLFEQRPIRLKNDPSSNP